MLIGAGGNFCPVARSIGVRRGSPTRLVFAQEVEFWLTGSEIDRLAVSADRPELYFCKDMRGYGWCFRKHDFLNVGLGRTDQTGLSRYSHLRLASYLPLLRQRLAPPPPTALLNLLPTNWVASAAARLLTTRWFDKRFVLDQFFLR